MASLRSYTLFIHVRLLLDFFARLSNKTMCLLSLSHREKQVSFAQFENFYDTNVKIILFKFYYIRYYSKEKISGPRFHGGKQRCSPGSD